MLSLHRCFPSPLYIMDEVDASLDMSTARRLGQLLHQWGHATRNQHTFKDDTQEGIKASSSASITIPAATGGTTLGGSSSGISSSQQDVRSSSMSECEWKDGSLTSDGHDENSRKDEESRDDKDDDINTAVKGAMDREENRRGLDEEGASSQFVVISHRPEVQEAASQVIGVYRRRGYPAVVVVPFY